MSKKLLSFLHFVLNIFFPPNSLKHRKNWFQRRSKFEEEGGPVRWSGQNSQRWKKSIQLIFRRKKKHVFSTCRIEDWNFFPIWCSIVEPKKFRRKWYKCEVPPLIGTKFGDEVRSRLIVLPTTNDLSGIVVRVVRVGPLSSLIPNSFQLVSYWHGNFGPKYFSEKVLTPTRIEPRESGFLGPIERSLVLNSIKPLI